jgi:hypothetical protein
MTLEPNAAVLFRRAVEAALTFAGVLGIILLLVRIDLRRLVLPAVLVGIGLLVTTFVEAQLIGGMRPLDSGDDGIAYEGYGRAILKAAVSGDLAAAMRGVEPVYHFTPGLRYVRALELFAFGETSLLYLSAILLLPVLTFMLFRRFLPPRWALVLALVFAVTPIGALFGSSLFQYVVWASRGYSDPFAFVLLLGAIVLIIPPSTGGRPGLWRIFSAGLLLAGATFCRPNLVLASAVMVAGAAVIWLTARQWARIIALVAGFATLVLSPLHNYAFGNAFVLFSDIVNQPTTLLMSPLDYARALLELVRFDFAGDDVKAAFVQLGRWLSGPQELLVMVPVHVLAVAVLVRVGVFGARFEPWLRVVALATLLQHGIGASYVNFARYNLGTWLLTLMVGAVWLDREGLELLCRGVPDICRAWRRHATVQKLVRLVDRSALAFGVVDAQQEGSEVARKVA